MEATSRAYASDSAMRHRVSFDEEQSTFLVHALLENDRAYTWATIFGDAVHNLRSTSLIRSVYASFAGLLPSGGGLFLLDLVDSPGPRTDQVYGRRRRIDDREVASLDAHLRWLAAAGFHEVDCLWKDGFEVALCGFAP